MDPQYSTPFTFLTLPESSQDVHTAANDNNVAPANGESPEQDAGRATRLFCESGGPNNTVRIDSKYTKQVLTNRQGDEVLHLPVIVDAAESSPAAAKEAARVIRKFLGPNNFNRAYVQYNAIMLLRILADHPGETFTRNIDSKFIATTKQLLRDGRDMSVQQILRETLDTFELQRGDDETLKPLIMMWVSEKQKWAKRTGNDISSSIMQQHRAGTTGQQPQPFLLGQVPQPSSNGAQFTPSRQPRSDYNQLPPPHELASRVEEAKTSSKLLMQVVQSTPQNEVLTNDLMREFAERCREASRSIISYINCDNPPPDEDTLLTLIETNDGIAAALSKHQRALLNARKAASSRQQAANQQQQPQQQQATNGTYNAYTGSNGVSRDGTATPPIPSQTVAKAGPPPILNMPKPPGRLENPFDDSNRTDGVTTEGGLGAISSSGYKYNSSSRALATDQRRDQQEEEDEEDESPAVPRTYRF